MPLDVAPRAGPVLLLYNVDPSWEASEREDVVAVTNQLLHAIADIGHPSASVPLFGDNMQEVMEPYGRTEYIVFNWCESIPGRPHSEPQVARELESMGFTFTGAGSTALDLACDKRRVKKVLEESGIPTPSWRLYVRPERNLWGRYPAIVKAANEHCSEGITRESVVMTEQELLERVSYIIDAYHQPALVEDFIDGREFHVSLWGNGRIEMLPPAEMDFSLFSDFHDRLCTHDSKCVPGSLHYEGIQTLLPAPLSGEELQALGKVCMSAYMAVGCRDYGRLDVRSRDGVYYVLDVNPNADISADASLACAAEIAGYSYGQAGSRIVRLAARRHPVWATQD